MTDRPEAAAVLATIGHEVLSAEPVTGGWDTLIWRVVTADGAVHALRLYRVPDHETAALEVWCLRAIRAHRIAAPSVEATGVFGGAPFILMSWLRGTPMLDGAEKKLPYIWALGRRFGRVQAKLHTVPAHELRAAADFSWRPAVEALSPRIANFLAGEARYDTLCHGDYHPLNLLTIGTRVTGVIDLSNASRFDRRADLSRTKAMLLASPLPPNPLNPIIQAVRKVFARAWQSGYTSIAGEWPLTPEWEVMGAAFTLADTESAVREGRGWATEASLVTLRRHAERCIARAGG